MKRIAIQGGPASFHHEAALKFTNIDTNVEYHHANTFLDLVNTLNTGLVDLAVMAIENKIAGRLIENDSLIDQYKLQIVDKVKLKIDLHLIANGSADTLALKEIYSHPVAFMQCNKFFNQYKNIRQITYHDTADAVSFIIKNKHNKSAAIAGELAANYYNAQILEKSIMDKSENWTEFYLLKK